VVIASEGETRFSAALDLITVPLVHPRLAFVLSTVAGHLFGYEAARAIDAQARPLREMRAAIERASAEGNIESAEDLLSDLQPLSKGLLVNSLMVCGPVRTTAISTRVPRCVSPRCCAMRWV
jgi:glucosamine--fructose-6-phosphate aminotransferase (isomerizing)